MMSTRRLEGKYHSRFFHLGAEIISNDYETLCFEGEHLGWWSVSFTDGQVKSLLPSFCLCGAALAPEPFRRGTCSPAWLIPGSPVCWISSALGARWSWSQKCICPFLYDSTELIKSICPYLNTFNIGCRCCSHGLLDHLLLQSSVSEKEVHSPLHTNYFHVVVQLLK